MRAGIKGKAIGWHSFRHSLATNLRAAGVDLKTAQELLRHANSRITLDVYTRAISATKREANNRVMEMVLEAGREGAFSTLASTLEGCEGGATKKVLRTSSTLSAPSGGILILSLAINPLFSLVYGGDDGARTRDLCRDS